MSRVTCFAVIAALGLAALSSLGSALSAAEPILITGARLTPAPAGVPTAAAFMTLRAAEGSDALIAAASPAAASVELHTHEREGEVMRMRRVAEIPLAPEAVLEPGGYHLMLFGLEKALIKGDSIRMTLTFRKAGEMTISVPVQGLAPPAMDHSGH